MKTRRSNPLLTVAVMTVTVILCLTTCKKDKDDAASSPEEYFKTLPSWEVFSPYMADADINLDTVAEFNCDDLSVLATIPSSMTRTPTDIATHEASSDVLYLGALMQGKSYRTTGELAALPIYQRAPLNITLKLLSNDVSRTVENPTNSTVQKAISEMVINAENDGFSSSSSIEFQQHNGYSLQQASLKAGFSARYMGARAKGKFHFENTSQRQTMYATFYQKMFTTTMEIPQSPMDLFSNEFTTDVLNEQIALGRISADNPPLYVASIVWGRMMTLTMTSTYSATEMGAALEASYQSIGSGQLNADYKEILANSDIQLVAIGGPDTTALNYLRTGNLGEFFKDSPALTSAEPLFYSLRNVSDNKPASVSEQVDYDMVTHNVVECNYYTDESDFEDVLVNRKLSYYYFPTTESNVCLANESPNFYPDNIPNGGQTAMGYKITWSESTTGLPFSFYLENKAVDNSIWSLVFGENEGSLPANTISIGDVNDLENDDFEIGTFGTGVVYGIGFNMISNTQEAGECLQVNAAAGCPIYSKTDGLSLEWNFMGFISEVPINRINFDEHSGSDDLGVMHFYFGYK